MFAQNYGTIRNLNISSGDVNINSITAFVGLICGYNYANINNCLTSGKINIETTEGLRVAGVTGSSSDTSVITDCKNYVDIFVSRKEAFTLSSIGGIAGIIGDEINRCANYGNIVVNSSGEGEIDVGGLCGNTFNSIIKDSTNKGKIKIENANGRVYVGGIVRMYS